MNAAANKAAEEGELPALESGPFYELFKFTVGSLAFHNAAEAREIGEKFRAIVAADCAERTSSMTTTTNNDSGLNLDHLEALRDQAIELCSALEANGHIRFLCDDGTANVVGIITAAWQNLPRRAAPVSAPTHCDPAEGFCATCREQEKASQAAPIAGDALQSLQRYEESDGEGGAVYKDAKGPFVKLEDVRAALANQPAPTAAPVLTLYAETDAGRAALDAIADHVASNGLVRTAEKLRSHRPAQEQAEPVAWMLDFEDERVVTADRKEVEAWVTQHDNPYTPIPLFAASPVVRAHSEESASQVHPESALPSRRTP